jgi:hypothetical protein
MHTWVTPSRHACGWSRSQSATTSAVRPSTCPSRPPVPAASTIPVSHRSATRSATDTVSGSWAQTGLPRRVSSIPSTSTGGSGAASSASTCATNAACATGQDTRYRAAAACTHEASVAIRSPHSERSRVVSRDRAGTDGRTR